MRSYSPTPALRGKRTNGSVASVASGTRRGQRRCAGSAAINGSRSSARYAQSGSDMGGTSSATSSSPSRSIAVCASDVASCRCNRTPGRRRWNSGNTRGNTLYEAVLMNPRRTEPISPRPSACAPAAIASASRNSRRASVSSAVPAADKRTPRVVRANNGVPSSVSNALI